MQKPAPIYSPLHTFVRGRQLEGTFPGEPWTGTWPITGLRVQKGWGLVPEDLWPYDDTKWPPDEPSEIDKFADIVPGFRYQRVRSTAEVKTCLGMRLPVKASLEIHDTWFRPLNGHVCDAGPNDAVVGTHCVLIVGYDDEQSRFKFRNSWAEKWGENGNGYISYSAFETYWQEAWTSDTSPSPLGIQGGQGTRELLCGVSEFGGGVLHCREIVDKDGKPLAWAFGVERRRTLEIEELFVMAKYRHRGLGKRLLESLVELAEQNSSELCGYLSHADTAPDNLVITQKMCAKHGLKVCPSVLGWAAYQVEASD